MLDVTLSERGNTQWFIVDEPTRGEAEPIYVNYCERCMGAIMICERKPEILMAMSKYITFSMHALPAPKREWNRVWKQLSHDLADIEKYYDVLELHICGGLVNTMENTYWYSTAQRKYIQPLRRRFPNAKYFQLAPYSDIEYSTLYMDEEFNVLHEQF